MIYIVSNDVFTKSYEADMDYKAIQSFKREYSLDSLTGIFVRPYGGSDKPASSMWPRSR